MDDLYIKLWIKLESHIKTRIIKKLKLLKEEREFRHLRFGLPYFVLEIGQYRICFTEDDEKKTRTLIFVGNHKEYEKWYNSI
jgi:mRNA-degrading endonuclease RelE of RelBE toxin-antitoxin system